MSLAAESLAPIGHNLPPTLADELADRHKHMLAEVDVLADRAASLPPRVANDIALGRLGDVVKDAGKLIKRIDTTRSTEVDPHLAAQRETNGFFKAFTERLDKIKRDLEGRATDYQRTKAAEERRIREEEARRAREEEERQRRIAEEAAAKNQAGKALKHEDRAEEASERAARAEVAAQASTADLVRVRSGTGTVATSRGGYDFAIEDAAKIPLDQLRPYIPRADLEKAIRAFVRMNKDAVPLAGVRIFKDDRASFR